MKQQTAVEWLEEQLNKWSDGRFYLPPHLFEQAKQMEKEQIITASSIGILWGEDEKQLQASVKFGEEYYDRTFTSTPQTENSSAKETGQS